MRQPEYWSPAVAAVSGAQTCGAGRDKVSKGARKKKGEGGSFLNLFYKGRKVSECLHLNGLVQGPSGPKNSFLFSTHCFQTVRVLHSPDRNPYCEIIIWIIILW